MFGKSKKSILIVGGGTSGSVLAARLSEDSKLNVTLVEAGPDHSEYAASVFDPSLAPDAWKGVSPIATTLMANKTGDIPMLQGRMLGGTSAVNGLATLRGLPEDYDGWAASGLDGWGWDDVVDTFIAAETDMDFPNSPLHGNKGPLTVRRWKRDEMSRAQLAFYDGMVEAGNPGVTDINDPSQLPGIGIFPVTIDDKARRMTTSLAYLTDEVRSRKNLTVLTNSKANQLILEQNRAVGIVLEDGQTLSADEIIVSMGALWSPTLLMRSGIGPSAHLQDHGIDVIADLPVGESLSDHLGPSIRYTHEGPRGGIAGPAQSLYIGASNGKDVDYHLFPIAPIKTDGPTEFLMAAFLLRSSGQGKVKLSENNNEPVVTAPPLPVDANQRLRHAFDRIAAWEQSSAMQALGCRPVTPHDLNAADAVGNTLQQGLLSYGHMTSSCPMGTVLDADCRVLGIEGLRVVDASVMPTIPSGNTYLGCVMIAERVARKMIAEASA
jgi:choline dehydrogenase